jgi:hypothetical protein
MARNIESSSITPIAKNQPKYTEAFTENTNSDFAEIRIDRVQSPEDFIDLKQNSEFHDCNAAQKEAFIVRSRTNAYTIHLSKIIVTTAGEPNQLCNSEKKDDYHFDVSVTRFNAFFMCSNPE